MKDPMRLVPEKAEDLLLKDAFEGITLPPAELVKEWPHDFKLGNDERSMTFWLPNAIAWTEFINQPATEFLRAAYAVLEDLGPGHHQATQGEADG